MTKSKNYASDSVRLAFHFCPPSTPPFTLQQCTVINLSSSISIHSHFLHLYMTLTSLYNTLNSRDTQFKLTRFVSPLLDHQLPFMITTGKKEKLCIILDEEECTHVQNPRVDARYLTPFAEPSRHTQFRASRSLIRSNTLIIGINH